jgi:hypothetical protein
MLQFATLLDLACEPSSPRVYDPVEDLERRPTKPPALELGDD